MSTVSSSFTDLLSIIFKFKKQKRGLNKFFIWLEYFNTICTYNKIKINVFYNSSMISEYNYRNIMYKQFF